MLWAALNHAFRDGKIASDTAWRKVQPFRNVDASRIRYLTVAEGKRLINARDPEFRPLVQAALASGCRYGELIAREGVRFQCGQRHHRDPQRKSGQAKPCGANDEGTAFLGAVLVAPASGSERLLRRTNGEPWESLASDSPDGRGLLPAPRSSR